jgi:hypothetical protein
VLAIGGLLIASPSAADVYHGGPDFNGDGVVDTVVGVPYESYQAVSTARRVAEAGAVDVIYGVAPGKRRLSSQHWTLANAGVPGTPAEGDHFGYAVVNGHFNDDAYPDLAIGIPGRDVDGIVDAGSVLVLYGSPSGLVASGPAMLHAPRLLRQGVEDVPSTPKYGDNFGFSLAAGESAIFPLAYLAIGAPGVTAGNNGEKGRGEVIVIYPDGAGVNQAWNQVVGNPEPGDYFGFSLATGNFGAGSLYGDDLAIGVPGEDVDGGTDAGAVEVLYMDGDQSPVRLSFKGADIFKQSTLGEPTQSRSWFGLSLAAGRLQKNGFYDDLVIGEPWRDVWAASSAGVVHVIPSEFFLGALDLAKARTIYPGRFAVGGPLPGVAEAGDWFGFSLSIGSNWLVVGVPGENAQKGAVYFIRGGYYGVTEDDAEVIGGGAADGQLGWSVAATYGQFAVGAPGSKNQSGAVHVFTVDDDVMEVTGKATLTQDSIFGAGEPSEPGDGFGFSVGAGGFPWINFTF